MKESIKFAIVFWPLLLIAEAAAVFITYETIGWMFPSLLLAPLFLFADFFILVIYCYGFQRGIIVGSVFMAIICQFVAPLGIRWYYVDREAKRIIAWAEAEKVKTGNYPDDLNDYQFQHPACREYIDYFKDRYQPEMGFGIAYTVGTSDTNHHYDPVDGWYYQDD